jgi:hypothetical protein
VSRLDTCLDIGHDHHSPTKMLRGSRKACSRQARQWQRAKRPPSGDAPALSINHSSVCAILRIDGGVTISWHALRTALGAALGIGRSACASIDQNYRIRPQTVGLPRGRYAYGRAPDPRTDGKRHCLYGVQPSCRHPAPQSRPAPHRTPGATEDWSPKGGLSLVQHPVAWRRNTLNDLNDAGAKAVETFR